MTDCDTPQPSHPDAAQDTIAPLLDELIFQALDAVYGPEHEPAVDSQNGSE